MNQTARLLFFKMSSVIAVVARSFAPKQSRGKMGKPLMWPLDCFAPYGGLATTGQCRVHSLFSPPGDALAPSEGRGAQDAG
jgi:hypothetical protein